jgi:hypothetical protein
MATALIMCSVVVLQSIKEGSEKPRGARTADKAGWIKKSSGGLLGLWKDRYLLLCQAQLLVYENEVRTCLALTAAAKRGRQASRSLLRLWLEGSSTFGFGCLFGCLFVWFKLW